MHEIEQVIAGVGRSMVLTRSGAYVWGNVRSVRILPAGLDEESICVSDKTAVGHWRYAQDIPQRMNPSGMRWDGVADTSGQLVAWSQGQMFQFSPQIVRDHGAAFVQVVELPGKVRQAWAAEQIAFAALDSGALLAWGDGAYGRLGVPGTTGGRRQPVLVQGVSHVRQLEIGTGHALALDASGRVWTWGANAAGQLGQGDLRERAGPALVKLPHAVKTIAAGATHCLALDVKGQLWGWGSNHYQQLDAGMSAYVMSPERMNMAGRRGALQALGAGMHFSAAVTREGDVLTWGWNGLAQLGRSTEFDQAPRKLELPPVQQISVGRTHVLALTRAGECWAWGDNRFGACQGSAGSTVQPQPHQVVLSAINFDSNVVATVEVQA